MNFFLPENDDLVDPHYDFENDAYGPDRDGSRTDVYAHEIYGSLNADGVLEADEVLAKHDEEYMPPEVAKAMNDAMANKAAQQPQAE